MLFWIWFKSTRKSNIYILIFSLHYSNFHPIVRYGLAYNGNYFNKKMLNLVRYDLKAERFVNNNETEFF
ncbi:hypothetical protein AHMF7605_13090 [Adhaeribacter arboris]|uniref:Uncharacterized protein n=1 Tax=Adhaeribacter arboris TaxID=2072846 RepID=A0A2T2YFU6_9BACT|nr:hypothetical protein AHMF7605_13090 [Adhaeribacter arboris]